ncbi:CDP-glycerol glycerophosphotransferase family protein [Isoptericola sp. NEAU-Y5]|uniref:CDP-glycerol glycerophosphotransferase family protein n=1 Tax=Isoptericola luteus TaxID=2879484 RepID=A0ABS7ZCG0_9MICO|nr:CDP-glycerol glycerophosphotransferase family protein [Isoptericola sp. NEAU-Y5]MCA5892736.1 CDP-glycerol glycerophosphotransferase family protein [Isoptericola sp. NEAU-Y5]
MSGGDIVQGVRRFQVVVDDLRLGEKTARFQVTVSGVDRRAHDVRIVVASRESAARHRFACLVEDDAQGSRRDPAVAVQRATAVVDLQDLAERLDEDDETLDLFVEVEDADGLVQSKRVSTKGRVSVLRPGRASLGGDVVQFLPYATFRAANVSVRVERMSEDSFAYLRRWTRLAWLLPLVRPFLGVWLVGELPYKAQDNGYHLFRWVREHFPRRAVYYVIEESSPDLPRLDGLGNVVLRGSREHIRAAFLASRIVGTHHAEYLLPSRHPRVVAGIRGVRVFIRHGISGTKNMTANYGRRAPGFFTDRFHVSSDRERDVALEAFGYRPGQVRVTGLPRFDSLLAPIEREPEGLLVIPTWREWLGQHDAFSSSEYRDRWESFLTHPVLAAQMRDGLQVTFILHPNMRHYADLFDAPGVQVLRQGEVDVQTLMREHACLVTDYSSVAFDFALLRRPVLYYQFDQERFFGPHGSFLDVERDLPGTIVTEVDRLADEVARAATSGFTMSPDHWERAQRMVRYHDRRNCERVADSVRHAGGPAVHWWRLVDRLAEALRGLRRRVSS